MFEDLHATDTTYARTRALLIPILQCLVNTQATSNNFMNLRTIHVHYLSERYIDVVECGRTYPTFLDNIHRPTQTRFILILDKNKAWVTLHKEIDPVANLGRSATGANTTAILPLPQSC